jgi:hypothetical protein
MDTWSVAKYRVMELSADQAVTFWTSPRVKPLDIVGDRADFTGTKPAALAQPAERRTRNA